VLSKKLKNVNVILSMISFHPSIAQVYFGLQVLPEYKQIYYFNNVAFKNLVNVQYLLTTLVTRMWANAQRDGRPAKYRRRPLFNAAEFG